MQFVLNACNISEYAQMALFRGESALETLIARLRGVSTKIIVITGTESPSRPAPAPSSPHLHYVRHPAGGVGELCTRLAELITDDFFLYVRADAPFVDLQCTQRMVDIHRNYAAEFTFADGYPGGFAPEILNTELLPVLPRLIPEGGVLDISTTLFSIIERDINAFDIETELAVTDMRSLRIQLHCDSRNNYLLCKALAKEIGSDTQRIPAVIQERPHLLRQVPMFVAFELLTAHPQTPTHVPRAALARRTGINAGEFSADLFRATLEQIAVLSPQAMIYFSLWGEIGLHSQLDAILRATDDLPMKCVCETSGVGWGGADSSVASSSVASGSGQQITWIVALDSNDPAVYARMRGQGFDEAQQFANSLVQNCPERTYIQAVRTRENEDSLEEFYRHWKKKTDHVLIQKYDHYSKQLEERKVVDISPVKRLPCWHNKRDLVVHVDGVVPLCREDVTRAHVLGNVHTHSIEEIWRAGQHYYHMHIQEDYPTICVECDEHYTYNN